MTMFPEFEGFRKRPIITYSRKSRIIPTTPLSKQIIQSSTHSSPIQNSLSSSSTCSELILEEEKQDIFNFPEQEGEVNLMVASTRSIPKPQNKPKVKKSFKKSLKANTKAAPLKVISAQQQPQVYPAGPYDIFSFEHFPYPPPESQYLQSSFSQHFQTSFITNNNQNIRPSFINNNQYIQPPYFNNQHIQSTVNNDKRFSTPKKLEKRNLVAHLKSASGENVLKRRFSFSEEEDEEPLGALLPIKQITKERSKSPELSYEERMEKELASIMQSEFGEKEEVHANERPRYQPLNEMKVRVTYTKRSK